jgi:hypothetical protein
MWRQIAYAPPVKSLISMIVGTVMAAMAASAAPVLLLETIITVENPNGGKEVVTPDPVPVESGKKAIIPFGKYEYAVTPILLADNTVEIRVVVTERVGEKLNRVAVPRIKARGGHAAEIKVGQTVFGIKITPADSAPQISAPDGNP